MSEESFHSQNKSSIRWILDLSAVDIGKSVERSSDDLGLIGDHFAVFEE
jgi:hypothetical protein